MSERVGDAVAGIRAQVLRAYGLKPWDIGLAPVPLRARIWRAVTLARRHGVIDWRGYIAAETEFRRAEQEFRDALPDRAQEIAGQLGECLPDGLRFEWVPDGE